MNMPRKFQNICYPRTRGYLDVWIDGKKVQSSDDFLQEEPILGKTYLPRKFKTAVVIPPTQ
jgi:sulfite reductase [NADPH] hemoprotein beta-component